MSIILIPFFVVFFAVIFWASLNYERIEAYIVKKYQISVFESRFYSERFGEVSPSLVNDRKGVGLTIWRVDVERGKKYVVYSYGYNNISGAQVRESLHNLDADLFTGDESRIRYTRIIENEVVCYKFNPKTDVEIKMQQIDKSTHACTISAPPQVGSMIGEVTVYFTYEPKITNALKNDMRNASNDFTTPRRIDRRMIASDR